MFRLICDYFTHYSKLPSPLVLQDLARSKNDEKLLASAIDISLTNIRETEFPYYLDQFINYRTGNILIDTYELTLDDIRQGHSNKAVEKIYNTISQINTKKQDVIVDVAASALQRFDAYQCAKNQPIGVPTGIMRLDHNYGGLKPGELVVVIAATGVGKSTFLQNVAVNAWVKGYKVVLVTLEISSDDVLDRIYSSLTQIPYSKFIMHDMTPSEEEIYKNKLVEVHKNNKGYLRVVDIARGCTPLVLESTIYNLLPSADLIIIDYMGEMVSPRRRDKDWEEQGEIALHLKQLARQWKIPVLTAVQTRREGSRGSFDITDISRSWLIANRADLCIGLIRIGESEVLTKVLKARRGQRFRFKLQFDFSRMTIRDMVMDNFAPLSANDVGEES
jgi:replicative DNA helicase